MSDRSALLAAICANPEDDAPRLAFADWLDANEPDKRPRKGAPSAWAALIRAECELERLEADGSAASAVFDYCARQDIRALELVRWSDRFPEVVPLVELHRTVEKFRKASAKARAAALPKSARRAIAWGEDTHRGFPASAEVEDWDRFVAALPELSAACPPVRLRLTSHEPPTGPAPGLVAWCRGLSVELRGPEHADLLVALSNDPATAGVRELSVESENGDECERALAAVAASPHWSGLRTFAFKSPFEFPLELRDRLFDSPALRGLTRLHLNDPETTPSPAVLAALPALRALALDWGAATDDHLAALAAAPTAGSLRELDLSAAGDIGRGVGAVLGSPHLRDLAVLRVDSAALGLDRAALAPLPPANLRVASFSKGKLSPGAVGAVLADGRFPHLLCFDGGYQMPRDAVAALVAALGARAPAVVRCHAADFGAANVRALAKAAGLAHTDVLDLWRVSVTAAGAKALVESPHLASLAYFSAAPADRDVFATLKARFGGGSSAWSTF